MTALLSDESIFTFESKGYADELRVLRVTGTEGLSELFSFHVELAARDAEIDLDSVVGVPAQLDINYEDGTRSVFGIVSRFEQGVSGETFTPYHAELVPTVWVLTQRSKSRIFQEMTVKEIIEKVLTDAKVDSDYFRFALQRTNYVKRDYCVQYRETDWDFASRLMEEEGIFYFFEYQDGKDVLVMADSSDVHVSIEGTADVVFRDPSGTVESEEFIYDFRFSQQIRSGTTVLRDYNFERPTLDLTKNQAAERDPALEVYEYPGLYMDEGTGAELTRIRLQSAQTKREVGEGESVCRRLVPGNKFNLADYPRTSFNQEYLLTTVHHQGTQPLWQDDATGRFHYDNRFQCIPSGTPFRPARKTPKPVVEGSQTAVVTGPSGEEIYVDQYGRVKVQFPWDREGQNNEKSSCWIRVSQLWAGTGWGAMFIPRIGHEVIVDFLEGDPDRPIITGRVYNGDNTTPYPLDAEKTKSTIKSDSSKGGGGSNEIRFEDLKGSEEIYQHAQKNLTIATENDKNQTTGHDETLTVKHDRTKTVKHDEKTTVENDRTETVNGKETITIKGDRTEEIQQGNEKVTVDTGNRTININTGNDEHNILTGNRTVNVNTGNDTLSILTGNRTINVNAGNEALNVLTGTKTDNIKGPYDITVQSDKFHLKCGGSELTMKVDGTVTLKGAGGTITIDSTGIKIEGQTIKSAATTANDTSGAMVSSVGSASNTIKGGMILLNP